MVFRTGIDLVEIDRFKRIIEARGDKFQKRIFTDNEIEYCLAKFSPVIHLAGRFAAKEAVYKAMRMEWQIGFCWKDIEVLTSTGGFPEVRFHKAAQEALKRSELYHIEVSITHTKNYAVASAVAWDKH